MKVYIGQTRSRRLISELARMGYGEMTNRGEMPPRRHPWALDNGAFKDWRAGREFDAPAFEEDLAALAGQQQGPDFVVCPDVVAGGIDSLRLSLRWAERTCAVAPAYLAVQDGLSRKHVEHVLGPFAGYLSAVRWSGRSEPARRGSGWLTTTRSNVTLAG